MFDIAKILQNIDEKKKKLDLLRPLPPELVKNLNEWFKVELTYNSNAIEGNTLTKSETALVIEKGLTASGKPLKDLLEAINLAFALDFIKNIISSTKEQISLNVIFDIRRLILKNIDDANAGKFRKIPVKISGSDVKLPDPVKVPDLMENFINWLEYVKEHPIKIAADAHYKIVAIHPFNDGNGRTARLVMNLILMKYSYVPAIIKKEDRQICIDSIRKAELENDLSNFYEYIFSQVEKSLDIYLEAANKVISKILSKFFHKLS